MVRHFLEFWRTVGGLLPQNGGLTRLVVVIGFQRDHIVGQLRQIDADVRERLLVRKFAEIGPLALLALQRKQSECTHLLHNSLVAAILADLRRADIYEADRILGRASNEAQEKGAPYAGALRVLSSVASYGLDAGDRLEPFRPAWSSGDTRSLIPSDLHAEQIAVLAEFASSITNPPMRARVNDVCRHLDPKNAAAGMRAVEAYVECVEAVMKGEVEFSFGDGSPAAPMGCDQLRRATVLASSMGWKRPEFDPLKQLISDITSRTVDEQDGWGFLRIANLAFEKGIWEDQKVADQAESLAKHPALAQDFRMQRELWQLSSNAYASLRDESNRDRCRVAAAETFVAEADARPDSAMVQASFLNDAIQALRPISGTAERRKELHARLSSVQPHIADEMSSFSHSEDITEDVKEIEEFIAGKPLPEVIKILFACITSPDPQTLRAEVLREAANSISAIMPVTVSDSQGRTRFKAPGLSFDGPPDEDQVKHLLNQHEQFRRQWAVATRFNPIRRSIALDHVVSVRAVLPIMAVSHFVPPDHELVFAKGFIRFLGGDDIEAASLIVPQLENSLRHLLGLAGIETNRINQDGTQDERTLGALLDGYREQLEKLIPASILQELDLLFNFRGGPSIRNELAHGKTPDYGFWNVDVVYGVWLILKLAVFPAFRRWEELSKEIYLRGGR